MTSRILGTHTHIAAVLAASLGVSTASPPALGVLDLKKGEPAPALSLHTLDGASLTLTDLRGRDVVLLFGEAGHDKTITALKETSAMIGAEPLAGRAIAWVVIYSRSSERAQIELDTAGLLPPPALVHDDVREAFGAYEIVAMPSAVVIDAQGRVVHALAGLSPRFGEIISASLMLASGSITDAQHEHVVHGMMEERDEAITSAERHLRLARRLHARGAVTLAATEYLLALELAPELTTAHLGLADLLTRAGRLDEAQERYRLFLVGTPRSLEATAGLALIHALRGGEELDEAERLARDVLGRSPHRPRAHFVLGLVHEKRGDTAGAAASYRKAAELLLDRVGPEHDEPD